MGPKRKKLVIFGDSAFAEVAYELFTHDSEYEVAAFTVGREYHKRDALFGVPVVPLDEIVSRFPPGNHEMFVALVYNNLNRDRIRCYQKAKELGYRLASYVSSRAFVWKNVEMGDNVFIFENNVVQPFVKLGSNLILWSGNHIGHHSTIGSHCFISSHVVISGFVSVGEACFFGVNSAVGNNLEVGKDCLVGAGALLVKDAPAGSLFRGPAASPESASTWEKFGVSSELVPDKDLP